MVFTSSPVRRGYGISSSPVIPSKAPRDSETKLTRPGESTPHVTQRDGNVKKHRKPPTHLAGRKGKFLFDRYKSPTGVPPRDQIDELCYARLLSAPGSGRMVCLSSCPTETLSLHPSCMELCASSRGVRELLT